ncbi:protein EURL homolog isoform X1 [Lepisosteus oculatus]|uniref:Chromosome 21 open reading frame 91 n=1 Tax=Lepisosteus oculatus TaxID=7918 RepID=W5MAM4_LEPOC|nr:PREDICTED: protein EURL homolog isoform X1 [Lepisosteus oculatus]
MNEEEQFVNIDLNDDDFCSVCKLETDSGTLSFCHVCFELSIEGVPSSSLLHSKSLRGHRDCFEKYHRIANQKLNRTKASRSTYEGVKNALSQKFSRIVQYAQNKEAVSDSGLQGSQHELLCYNPQGDHKLVPQADSQVPRYAPRWAEGTGAALPACAKGMLACPSAGELGLSMLGHGGDGSFCSESLLWAGGGRAPRRAEQASGESQDTAQCRHEFHSREELSRMTVEELRELKEKFLVRVRAVFEELTVAVQEKDSLASELHVRHIAIEQLFKNCAKLPWLQIGRAGAKPSSAPVE